MLRFAHSAGANRAIIAILKRNTIIPQKSESIVSWMSFVTKNIHLSIKWSIFPRIRKKRHSKRFYCIVERNKENRERRHKRCSNSGKEIS